MSAGKDINKKNEITVIEDMKKGAPMGDRQQFLRFGPSSDELSWWSTRLRYLTGTSREGSVLSESCLSIPGARVLGVAGRNYAAN